MTDVHSGILCRALGPRILNLFFVGILGRVIAAATAVYPQLHMVWPLGIPLAGFLMVTLYYLRRIYRTANEEVQPAVPSRART